MKTERILTLLRQSYSKDSIKKIVLVHIVENGQKEDARTWDIKDISLSDYPNLAEEIFDTSQSIADELQHPERFKIIGYDGRKKEIRKNIIRQVPDKEHQIMPSNGDGVIALAMQQTKEALQDSRAAMKIAMDTMKLYSEMQKQSDAVYVKKLNAYEEREQVLIELIEEHKKQQQDASHHDYALARFDRLIEVASGYLLPALARKGVDIGLLTEETAAALSATGLEIAEEISKKENNETNK